MERLFLAILLPVLSASAEVSSLSTNTPQDTADVLKFIAATQRQTSQIMDRLSYQASVVATSYVEDIGQVTRLSLIKVRKRSDTILLTREDANSITATEGGQASGSPKFELSDEPHVQMVLKTPDFIAVWGMVPFPEIIIRFTKDWAGSDTNFTGEFNSILLNVDVSQISFGVHAPFFRYYEKAEGPWWGVEDAGSNFKVVKFAAAAGKDPVANLTYVFDKVDGLMLKGISKPPELADETISEVVYGEVKVGDAVLKLPIKRSREGLDQKLRTPLAATVEFSGYMDESRLPPFTLQDMGVPQRATLSRTLPNSQTPETRVWDGEKLSLQLWEKSK